MQLTKDKGVESPTVRAYGICLQYGHPTDMCPMLQEDTEKVQAVGGYPGQNQGNFDQPKNHQNWGYQQNPNFQPRSQPQQRHLYQQNNPPSNFQPQPQHNYPLLKIKTKGVVAHVCPWRT